MSTTIRSSIEATSKLPARWCLVLVMLACSISGCQSLALKESWNPSKGLPWGPVDDTPQTPDRLVAYWTESTLNRAGEPAQRGFGGRFYFYARQEQRPVKVEGRLVVYAFDETNRDPTDNRPTRRYIFPAEQMELHYSKSDIGPSYSFWLPWGEAGGMQKEISLIARFEPKMGGMIVSPQTRHRLPGTMAPGELLPPPAGLGNQDGAAGVQYTARQVGFASEATASPEQTAAAQSEAGPRGIATTTITLPKRFGHATPQVAASRFPSTAEERAGGSRLRPAHGAFQARTYGSNGGYGPDAGAPLTSQAGAGQPGGTPFTGRRAEGVSAPPAAHSSPWSHPAQGIESVPLTTSPPRWPQSPAGSPFAQPAQPWGQSHPSGTSGFSTPAPGSYR